MSDVITIQHPTTGEAWTSGFRGQPPKWVSEHPDYIAFRKEHPAKNAKYKKSTEKSVVPKEPVQNIKKVRKNTLEIPYATSSADPFIQDLINNRENFKKALVCNSLVRKSWGALSVDLNSLLATFCDRFACFAYSAKYVNVKGYDAEKGTVKISNKAMKTMFQKTTGKTGNIIMSNKLHNDDAKESKQVRVETINYDYIIVVQTEGSLSVAVAKYSDVKHLIVQKKSTTELSIPLSHLTYIVSPSENYNFEDSEYEYESPSEGLVIDPMRLDGFVDLICSHFWNEVKLPTSQMVNEMGT